MYLTFHPAEVISPQLAKLLQNKQFPCPVCGYHAISPSALFLHLFIHVGGFGLRGEHTIISQPNKFKNKLKQQNKNAASKRTSMVRWCIDVIQKENIQFHVFVAALKADHVCQQCKVPSTFLRNNASSGTTECVCITTCDACGKQIIEELDGYCKWLADTRAALIQNENTQIPRQCTNSRNSVDSNNPNSNDNNDNNKANNTNDKPQSELKEETARREVDGYSGPASLNGRRLSDVGQSGNVKLLFLDVDGVLNFENSEQRLCLEQMNRLKKIIELTDCKIVLSTSWRISPKRKQNLLTALKNDGKIDVNNVVLGSTPSFRGQYGYKHRPLEIYEYLTHGVELHVYNNYKVVSWVAIDDLGLAEYNNNIMEGHFVKTNMKTGLTDEDVTKAAKILNNADKKEHVRLQSLHKEVSDAKMKHGLAIDTLSITSPVMNTNSDEKSNNTDLDKENHNDRIASIVNPQICSVTSLGKGEKLHSIERVGIKLLFLNIDGVLNFDGYISQVNNGMSPDHIARLGKIVEKTNCKIVFSTNRRLQDVNKEKALAQLNRKISENWTKKYYLGDTPHVEYKSRPFEIQRFLDEIENHPFLLKIDNSENMNTSGENDSKTEKDKNENEKENESGDKDSSKKVIFEVVSWCAIDDISLNKINTECWNIMNGRFVQTNSKYGMTDDNADLVIKILNDTTGVTKHNTSHSTISPKYDALKETGKSNSDSTNSDSQKK